MGLPQSTHVTVREQLQESVLAFYLEGLRDQNWIIKLVGKYGHLLSNVSDTRGNLERKKCEELIPNILK